MKGDEVVVMRGISKDAHGFIRLMAEQLSNGGMFAKVLANCPPM